jgi:hypothetical protein
VIVHEEVWQLKHAYRETCMCRLYYNLRLYVEASGVLWKILLLLEQASNSGDAPDESDAVDEDNLQERPEAPVSQRWIQS